MRMFGTMLLAAWTLLLLYVFWRAATVPAIARRVARPLLAAFAAALWATFAVSDGSTLWCMRYASDGDAPSLYYSASAEDIYAINPAIAGHFGPKARTVVSEPVGAYAEMWNEAPQSSWLVVRDGDVSVEPFKAMAM